MTGKLWQPLKVGDIVDVVAPGSAIEKANLKKIEKFLNSWGLKARIPRDILKPFLFHAAPDDIRSQQLRSALLAKDSKAVWCIRGGYGANRLIPDLAQINAPLMPKLFIGLSDITSIHTYLNDKWNWTTLHGPILDRAGRGDLSKSQLKELKDILFGQQKQVEFKVKPLNEAAKKVQSLKSSFIGGNLVTFQSTWGTFYQPSLKDRFVFGEEIGERAYRLDRILAHLTQLPDYLACKGVFFGTFTDCKEPGGKSLVTKTLQRFASGTTIPVFAGLPVGHDSNQRCLPLGSNARVERELGTGSKFVLKVDSGFVS